MRKIKVAVTQMPTYARNSISIYYGRVYKRVSHPLNATTGACKVCAFNIGQLSCNAHRCGGNSAWIKIKGQ